MSIVDDASVSDSIDVKRFLKFFYSCHVFFYFPYVFKIKNVENLLSK